MGWGCRREEMYRATSENKRAQPEVYRDEYPDEHLVAEARAVEQVEQHKQAMK